MRAEDIAKALACGRSGCPCGRRAGKGWVTHCPAHNDVWHPNLNASDAHGTLLVHCFTGCPQDAVISALRERRLWPGTASGRARRTKAVETRYEVRDLHGTLVAVHERRDQPDGSKTLFWRQADGTLGLNGAPVSSLPLYGSERLATQPNGDAVVVTEGEKAADALTGRGILAVATVTGANETPCSDSLSVLLPYRVILWPDADDGGQKHMVRAAERLMALDHSDLRTVEWADAPPKGDAADFTGDDAELKALLEGAKSYQPPPRVDLAALLDDVRAFIRRYVVLTDAQADAVALWVLHTWALDVAECTPYLSVTSAEKRSGKTLLLETLDLLVASPWLTGRVTAAVLYRKIDAERPTLLLDESDAAFKGEKDYAEALRGVLNTGHRRGGKTSTCVGQGANMSYRDFSTFSPKAIAGIGWLPDTVADRAIPIVLKRRAPNEQTQRFRRRDADKVAGRLRERLELWATANGEGLGDARPLFPTELDDRAVDSWEPLFAIADAAGGEWPQRARSAALTLSAGDGRDDDSLGVRLLRDIRVVFEERGTDRLSSGALAEALVGMEEAPWGDLRGKSLDARGLARRLKPFGIRPHQVRFEDKTLKGYTREDFADAWVRYIPRRTETSETSETKPSARFNLSGQNVSDVSLVSLPAGMDAPPNAPSFRDDDGQRLYLYSLAQELGFPAVSLGERQRNGRTVSVGVPGGRFAWEQAARFWPDDELRELLGRLEEMMS